MSRIKPSAGSDRALSSARLLEPGIYSNERRGLMVMMRFLVWIIPVCRLAAAKDTQGCSTPASASYLIHSMRLAYTQLAETAGFEL